jgi:hypothetical protein
MGVLSDLDRNQNIDSKPRGRSMAARIKIHRNTTPRNMYKYTGPVKCSVSLGWISQDVGRDGPLSGLRRGQSSSVLHCPRKLGRPSPRPPKIRCSLRTARCRVEGQSFFSCSVSVHPGHPSIALNRHAPRKFLRFLIVFVTARLTLRFLFFPFHLLHVCICIFDFHPCISYLLAYGVVAPLNRNFILLLASAVVRLKCEDPRP